MALSMEYKSILRCCSEFKCYLVANRKWSKIKDYSCSRLFLALSDVIINLPLIIKPTGTITEQQQVAMQINRKRLAIMHRLLMTSSLWYCTKHMGLLWEPDVNFLIERKCHNEENIGTYVWGNFTPLNMTLELAFASRPTPDTCVISICCCYKIKKTHKHQST